jgi:uncharacterized protein (DUF427 family)
MSERIRTEPGTRRVRGLLAGEYVADTTSPLLVWEVPYYPTYYFPVADVAMDALEETAETRRSPSRGEATLLDLVVGDTRRPQGAYLHPDPKVPELADHVAFKWAALDHWFEEDEEVFVHARDPYTRVDILRSSRTVRVEIEGVEVARSSGASFLYETGLPVRYYLPKTDVRFDLFTESDKVTYCPYKGTARYWTAHINGREHPDILWGYDYPVLESARIAGLVSFYDDKVDLFVENQPA